MRVADAASKSSLETLIESVACTARLARKSVREQKLDSMWGATCRAVLAVQSLTLSGQCSDASRWNSASKPSSWLRAVCFVHLSSGTQVVLLVARKIATCAPKLHEYQATKLCPQSQCTRSSNTQHHGVRTGFQITFMRLLSLISAVPIRYVAPSTAAAAAAA